MHAYVFDSSLPNAAGTKGDCSLVKYGSTDILINCGTADCSNGALSHYADDIARYCVDGVIELLIVTSPLIDAYRELVDYYEGGKCVREGIFSQYEIKQVVDFGDTVKTDVRVNQKSVYNRYLDAVEKEKTERKSIESCAGESLNFAEKFSVEFLRSDTYGTENTSICCLFNFYGKKMLFTGFLMDTGEEYLVKNNNLSNVVFYKASCYGNVNANTKVLMEEIKSKSNLYVAVNGIPKGNSENDNCLKKSTCEDLLNNSKKVCLTERINQNGEYERVYGDIHFTMSQTKGKIDTKSYAMNGSLEKETATFRSFYKTR